MTQLGDVNKGEQGKVEQAIRNLLQKAVALVVRDHASHADAEDLIKSLAHSRQVVVGFYRPSREATHAAWKAVLENEKAFVKPLDQARDALTRKCASYEQHQREAAAAESRRVQEEEAKKRQEQADSLAADAAMDGDTEGADMILAAEEAEPPPPAKFVEPQFGVQPGIQTRRNYFAVPENLHELVDWAGENSGDRAQYLDFRLPALNRWAKDYGEGRTKVKIPGVRVEFKDTKVVRG